MSNTKDRFQTIYSLRKQEYTFQEIGDMLKISRQRAHQIYTQGMKKITKAGIKN